MGFYQEISKYYDDIFPTGGAQVKFLTESAGQPVKSILDIACGSGGYSIELAKKGHRVTAVDLDREMLAKVNEKAQKEGLSLDVRQCDMKELQGLGDKKYNLVFCIGNSIVHLVKENEIFEALRQMHHLTEHGGTLVLQIINYDRVLKYNIRELPLIKNDAIGLEFTRKYERDQDSGLMAFNTVLSVENQRGRETYENTVNLYPLTSDKLLNLLQEAGFLEIKFYGDFKGLDFNDDAYMLVVKAFKK